MFVNVDEGMVIFVYCRVLQYMFRRLAHKYTIRKAPSCCILKSVPLCNHG
jgi:hypothetical protein